MDNTEIHYLTYDMKAIMEEMQMAYIDAGGDVLYPGDEKEMFLRAVGAILAQGFAGVDNALRMGTLRYAMGEYLDLYGESRGCFRLLAQQARATVQIQFRADGVPKTIPEGTAVTADGEKIYLLTEDAVHTGGAQTMLAEIIAKEPGANGNGLTSGTQMQFAAPEQAVESIVCYASASGGQDEETDEAYRSRIRTIGQTNITTGPRLQYEAAAKKVSSEILDARAVNLGAGTVGVYLLISDEDHATTITEQVRLALNDRDVRPLTDTVGVSLAEDVLYVLNMEYTAAAGTGIAGAVAAAVEEYQNWQDNIIGQTFNPDRLMAAVYQAGASRVQWGDESEFDDGPVQYTPIAGYQRCKGKITITEVVE